MRWLPIRHALLLLLHVSLHTACNLAQEKRRPSPARERDAFVPIGRGPKVPALCRHAPTPLSARKQKSARHSRKNDGRLCPCTVCGMGVKEASLPLFTHGPMYTIAPRVRQDILDAEAKRLHVVVQEELIGMRPQPHSIHFLAALVADPGLDQVLAEHPALEQELMVLFEMTEGLV